MPPLGRDMMRYGCPHGSFVSVNVLSGVNDGKSLLSNRTSMWAMVIRDSDLDASKFGSKTRNNGKQRAPMPRTPTDVKNELFNVVTKSLGCSVPCLRSQDLCTVAALQKYDPSESPHESKRQLLTREFNPPDVLVAMWTTRLICGFNELKFFRHRPISRLMEASRRDAI